MVGNSMKILLLITICLMSVGCGDISLMSSPIGPTSLTETPSVGGKIRPLGLGEFGGGG